VSNTYHMIGYIREGPEALHRTLQANEAAIQSIASRVRTHDIQRVIVTGIGSSYTAAVMAAPVFRYHCPLPAHIMSSPEMGYYASRLVDERTLVIAVSRSGERDVVINALTDSVERGAFGVAVTGVAESLLAQNAQLAMVTGEGPEITFPKTKSVIACAGLLMRLGLALARSDDGEASERLRTLRSTPRSIERVVKVTEPAIQALMPKIEGYEPVAIVGTGSNYGVAIEGAMKIQEAAYVATRYDTTDGLLNGPVGALTARWLVVPLITVHDVGLSQELLRVVRKFGAHSLCVSEPDLELEGVADHVLTLPEPADPLLAALVYLPPLQLLTYYWTLARNMNPDVPTAMRAILDAVLPPGRQEPELR